MKRSIVQTGSSLAVTLPMEVVQAFGLQKGQEVEVAVHPQTGAITIRPGVAYVEGGLSRTDSGRWPTRCSHVAPRCHGGCSDDALSLR